MSNAKHAPLYTLLAAALLSACSSSPVGPQDSGIPAPSLWARLGGAAQTADLNAPLAAGAGAEVDQHWWRHFDDATLDALIAKALAGNKTLQIAKARVEEARAGRALAQSSLMPQVNAAVSAQHGNQGYLTNNQTISLGQADIEATWELDLFGRNRALTAQASAILQSAEASQQAIRVALLAEVAHSYFDMRNYQRQIDLTQKNLATQQQTLELVRAQQAGALASELDVRRASAQVSATAALIPALQSAYEVSLNRLNVLLGDAPGSNDALLESAPALPPLDQHILIAAPARVLAARPDIRAAERNFAASISARNAAQASLFPDISLTALFGAQTATPFSSTPWNLGANLVQPLLNFGRLEAQIDAADAGQKQAFLGYQQTVLAALENMENALSGYLHETARNAALAGSVAQNRKAAELVRQQYANGYAGLLDVLVAERNLLDAESGQAASDISMRNDLVSIYAAAGGGWSD
jgi:NodT family efflux transporter outer membrane factor (OMF) lipoprotein